LGVGSKTGEKREKKCVCGENVQGKAETAAKEKNRNWPGGRRAMKVGDLEQEQNVFNPLQGEPRGTVMGKNPSRGSPHCGKGTSFDGEKGEGNKNR